MRDVDSTETASNVTCTTLASDHADGRGASTDTAGGANGSQFPAASIPGAAPREDERKERRRDETGREAKTSSVVARRTAEPRTKASLNCTIAAGKEVAPCGGNAVVAFRRHRLRVAGEDELFLLEGRSWRCRVIAAAHRGWRG
jgi:hypothetical protein